MSDEIKKAMDEGAALKDKIGDRLSEVTGSEVAKAVGVAVAAVAGAVVAVQAVRRRAGSDEEESIFHLKQMGDQWALLLEGESAPDALFATKEEGLTAARELAQRSTPCELVIYRADGTFQNRHAYES